MSRTQLEELIVLSSLSLTRACPAKQKKSNHFSGRKLSTLHREIESLFMGREVSKCNNNYALELMLSFNVFSAWHFYSLYLISICFHNF